MGSLSSSPSLHYTLLLLLLFSPSNHLLRAQAQGIDVRSSHSSSSEEGSDSGGLDQAFATLITKMLQSWKFAPLGMAIFGGIFALILIFVSAHSVNQYHNCKRGVGDESNKREGAAREGKKRDDKGNTSLTSQDQGRGPDQVQPIGQEALGKAQVGEPTRKLTDAKQNKSTWNTGSAFCWFSFAASCSLSAYYPLFIVNQIHVDGDTRAPIPVEGLTILTSAMADITIACAFLALIRRRVWIHFSSPSSTGTVPQSTPSDVDTSVESPKPIPVLISSPRFKMTLDRIIVFLMASLAITNTVLACLHTTYTSEGRLKWLGHLLHAYRASYLLVTIDVIGSAFMLHRALAGSRIQDELISYTLCMCVCPLLGLQAVFWLIDEIIKSAVPANHIKQDALVTAEVAIVFGCYTWALFNGLSGFSPKKSK